jgi:hypothetical protein
MNNYNFIPATNLQKGTKMNSNYDLTSDLLVDPIIPLRQWALLITSTTSGAILITQLHYHWNYFRKEFYKSDNILMNETKLSKRTLARSKSQLLKLGLISTCRKGPNTICHYEVNIDRIKGMLETLYSNKPLLEKTLREKEDVPIYPTISQNGTSLNKPEKLNKNPPQKTHFGSKPDIAEERCAIMAHKERPNKDIYNNPPKVPPRIDEMEIKDGGEALKIWNKVFGKVSDKPSQTSLANAGRVFKSHFKLDKTKFESYCLAILSSRFLMEEANNKFFKRLTFQRACNPSMIEKILDGHFTVGDRLEHLTKQIEIIEAEHAAHVSGKKNQHRQQLLKLLFGNSKEYVKSKFLEFLEKSEDNKRNYDLPLIIEIEFIHALEVTERPNRTWRDLLSFKSVGPHREALNTFLDWYGKIHYPLTEISFSSPEMDILKNQRNHLVKFNENSLEGIRI